MKKIFMMFTVFLLCLVVPNISFASEQSSDKMIMEWQTNKVWLNNGDLCAEGTFTNKRGDLTVTKLNEFSMKFTFTKADGSEEVFMGKPVKLPMCKIPAGQNKKIILNFGKFDGEWKSWVAVPSYVFTYINGLRW